MDAIPGPEYLATANSLGFSISVRFTISFFRIRDKLTSAFPGCRTRDRPFYYQLVFLRFHRLPSLLSRDAVGLAYDGVVDCPFSCAGLPTGNEKPHQGKSEHEYEEEQYELIVNDEARARRTGV